GGGGNDGTIFIVSIRIAVGEAQRALAHGVGPRRGVRSRLGVALPSHQHGIVVRLCLVVSGQNTLARRDEPRGDSRSTRAGGGSGGQAGPIVVVPRVHRGRAGEIFGGNRLCSSHAAEARGHHGCEGSGGS